MEVAGILIGIIGVIWTIYAWKNPNQQELSEATVAEEEVVTSSQKAKTIYNIENIQSAHFDYNGKKITKVLGALLAKPNLFIGRGNSTAEIHEKLNNQQHNNLLLLVNGNGGIGKTTMAAQYYFEYFEHYAHLIWLVSEKGIKEALVSLALSLRLTFNEQLNQAQQIEEIIRNVSELEKPVLLIIDNANNLTDLDDNFRLLRQFQNTHILITSKVNDYPNIENYKVNHLDKQSANELFKYHFKAFKATEQALLDELLEAIGYNTLVIELLSKNLNEFNNDIKSHYPLKKLLEDIQVKGILAISKSTPINADYKLEPATPEAIISTMFDVSPLTENEKHILSIFAVLPATAIPFNYLEQFLPGIEALDRVLITLSIKGWIEYDKTFQSFKTNPIISEIARTQNKDRLEEDTLTQINFFIDKLKYVPGLGHIEGDFNEIQELVNYSEVFANNYDILNFNKFILFDSLGNFYKTYGNLDKALKFFEDGSQLTKEHYESNPNNEGFKSGLAISYSKFGETHTLLGNLDKALKFFEDQTELFEELYESHPNNVGFKNGLAVSYEKLGDTHTSLGNLDKALKFFEEDLKLTNELYESHPKNVGFKNGLAIANQYLGNTHTSLGNLDKALTFFEERSRLGKELYKSNQNNVSFKNGLAISYEKLGDTHTSLGNLDKALKFFEEDLKLTNELYESHPKNVDFKNGLAIANEKLGTTHTSLGNLNKALSFFEERYRLTKELYKSHPNNVDFKNGLAIAYLLLGGIIY